MVNQLRMDMFISPIKEAADKTIGKDMTVRIELGIRENGEGKKSKLDSLRSFGNVEFE
jgi:hypothetical protein